MSLSVPLVQTCAHDEVTEAPPVGEGDVEVGAALADLDRGAIRELRCERFEE